MTWSCPVCSTVNRDHWRKCSARDCRYPGGPAPAWQNSGKDAWNSKTASVPAMGRRWTCRACSYENYSWRAVCHSCNQAAESAGRGGNGGASTRRPAQRTTLSDVLSAECDRLRGGSEAPGADAMLVEEGAVAKSEEQGRLKALDASIANLEKARGGKPDDAIDEVLRLKRQERQELKDQMQFCKSTEALLRTAIGARGKAVIKLEGLKKEEVDLTQLLLLKQQEIADAKNDAAEKAREVETLQAKRLAEVDCDGSVSHGSSASFSSPRSPQQWALGLAASLSEDVRVKFEDWWFQRRFRGQGFRVADADHDEFSGIQLSCCQSSFPLATGCALCCGVSDEQES